MEYDELFGITGCSVDLVSMFKRDCFVALAVGDEYVPDAVKQI